jgi:hypothetical protein
LAVVGRVWKKMLMMWDVKWREKKMEEMMTEVVMWTRGKMMEMKKKEKKMEDEKEKKKEK